MEQRSSIRMPFKERAKFGHIDRPYYEATISDISESGICLVSYEPLAENTIASIIVYYGHKPLNLHGKVKWVNQITDTKQFRMGIELDKKAQDLNLIYNFLFK